jgi:hypothetical protein
MPWAAAEHTAFLLCDAKIICAQLDNQSRREALEIFAEAQTRAGGPKAARPADQLAGIFA